MSERKQCPVCKRVKYLHQFYKHPHREDALSYECMNCSKARVKKSYEDRKTIMSIYYNGELIQQRIFTDEAYKYELLRMFKKLYGKRFNDCQIEYKPYYHQKKAACY